MTSAAGLISHKGAARSCHVTVLPGLALKNPLQPGQNKPSRRRCVPADGGTPPAAREQVLEQNYPIRLARRHGNHLLMKPYYGVFFLILDAFIQHKQLLWDQGSALVCVRI